MVRFGIGLLCLALSVLALAYRLGNFARIGELP